MDDDQRESGRIPRTVECELTADLGRVMTEKRKNSTSYYPHSYVPYIIFSSLSQNSWDPL